jgi:hypothetical protein
MASCLVLGLGAALGPASAAAAPLTWTDAADDATVQAPLPSEPELDILRSSIGSDGKKVLWTIAVKALTEAPVASVGYSFRFHFTFDDVHYFFDVNENSVLGNGTYFAEEDDPAAPALGCAGCAGRIDKAKNLVTLSVPITTIAAGVRATDSGATPPNAGAELDVRGVDAWRDEGLLVLLADEAPAPERAVITL